jgi:hypothetical protein
MAAFTATQVPACVQVRLCSGPQRGSQCLARVYRTSRLHCALTTAHPVAHQARAVSRRSAVVVRASAAPETGRRAFAAAVFGGKC